MDSEALSKFLLALCTLAKTRKVFTYQLLGPRYLVISLTKLAIHIQQMSMTKTFI